METHERHTLRQMKEIIGHDVHLQIGGPPRGENYEYCTKHKIIAFGTNTRAEKEIATKTREQKYRDFVMIR
jgi:hypothetical protein